MISAFPWLALDADFDRAIWRESLTFPGLPLLCPEFLRPCDSTLTGEDLGGEGKRRLSWINSGFSLHQSWSHCQCSAPWLYPSYPQGTPYLLSDGTGTLDQLPLGIAVCGAHLEGPCLLHQEDTAMAQVLHTCANLESDLQRQSQKGEGV